VAINFGLGGNCPIATLLATPLESFLGTLSFFLAGQN